MTSFDVRAWPPHPAAVTTVAYLFAAGSLYALLIQPSVIAWHLVVIAVTVDAWSYRLRARRNASAVARLTTPAPNNIIAFTRDQGRHHDAQR